MPIKRIYDPAIEAQAKLIPRRDFSDVVGVRAIFRAESEKAAANGVKRLTDDRVDEIERSIRGPAGAPDVPIRIYMPKDRREAGAGFLNIHGGGFVFGDLESEHFRCLIMAAEGGAVSVGVDYRLAPEHPFPASVEDCYAALQWVAENAEALKIDPTRIAIGGCSSGGNLTAGVALMARDRGGPRVAFQMLIQPVIDDRCETTSMINATDLYLVGYQRVLLAWDHYIGKERGNVSPYASPARAEDLSGLPPAYIMTGEHDSLRDEAIIYAMRLMADGVPVELHNFPGTAHGFEYMPSEVATRAINEGVEAFKRAMAREGVPYSPQLAANVNSSHVMAARRL